MTKEKLDEVAEKVKKLLAQAEGTSFPEEAELAASMAEQLLKKYNMTLTDVEIKTAEMLKDVFGVPQRGKTKEYGLLPHWIKTLATVINKYFYIKVVVSRKPTGTFFNQINFLGARKDVEVARYVFCFLVREIERLGDKYMKKNHKGTGLGIRQMQELRMSYSQGVVEGIGMKLKHEAEIADAPVTANGTDLIIVKGDAVNQFTKETFKGGLRPARSRTNLGHQDGAYSSGVEAGQGINIKTRDQRTIEK